MFQIDNDEYSLRQSTYHPSLWFVVRSPWLLASRKVRLPDDNDLPDVAALGKHKHVAAFLVYVDDVLAAGPRDVLQPLLTRLLTVWKGSDSDFLGRQPEDGTWLVHQQNYIYPSFQEMFDPECLKDRRTPGESESFSDKPGGSLMLNHMRRKHVSNIHHYNQAKILWNMLQFYV